MSYRPQFAFAPAPAGWQEEDFIYVFDAHNTPGLAVALAAGDRLLNIVLPLETDAEFRVRSIEVINLGTCPALVRFRDAFGTLLSPDFLPSAVYTRSGAPVVDDSELLCPKGSTLSVDLFNPGCTSGPV